MAKVLAGTGVFKDGDEPVSDKKDIPVKSAAVVSKGLYFISALLTGAKDQISSVRVNPDVLKPLEREYYEFIKKHVTKYGVIPTVDTLMIGVPSDGPKITFPVVAEPAKYYYDDLVKTFQVNRLKQTVLKSKDLLTPPPAKGPLGYPKEERDPQALINLFSPVLHDVITAGSAHNSIDLRKAGPLLKQAYVDAFSGTGPIGLSYGWETLDELSNGGMPGDLVIIAGRPGMGKTWLMLYSALHRWQKHKIPTVFCSMEIMMLGILQRIAALLLHKPFKQIQKGSLTTQGKKALFAMLDELAQGDVPFIVIDGNLAATVDDIWSYAAQIGAGSVYIDGAYLLRDPKLRGAPKHERVAEIARDIKMRIATDLGIPATTSYQFNREMVKNAKKDRDKSETLSQLAGSDELGQLASLVLGLFDDDTIENEVQRNVEIIKGRNGEIGSYPINWNFLNMDFSERKSVIVEDMQFI